MTTFYRTLAGALCLWGAFALVAVPATAQVGTGVNCNAAAGTPTGHIDWPANNPVWSFDFIRPARSTGPDGSGIEIRNVMYNGTMVFKRAHAPVLNVQYQGSGCGCFRDWQDSESGFRADGVMAGQTCFANSTPGFVRTTCDINQQQGQGGEAGTFRGVAVEDFGTELVVTSDMSAGWYRYRMKWHFYLDGRIWPEYSFGTASATCTSQPRRHHVYWRFDFDLFGTPNNDVITERTGAGGATTFTNEAARNWAADPSIYWTIEDGGAGSGNGYSLRPSSADLLLPYNDGGTGSFAQLDAAILRYNPTQIDDGSGSCAINQTGMGLNNETLAGQDVVLWYRSGSFKAAGSNYECDIVGPMLTPMGAIPVELTSFDAVVGEGRTATLRWGTASETNNAGFQVEHRLVDEGTWSSLGFVEGHGTTTEAQQYAFTTGALQGGLHVFRLKQVDFDGASEYSEEVEVAVDVPGAYVLESAYPNPFNPTTTVRFKVTVAQEARIEVIDALGRIVQTPFNGYVEANSFEHVRIDGSDLPSGSYTVRLTGETVQGSTRVVLIK